jgi:hypothetical protein
MIKSFHELTKKEYFGLIKNGYTYEHLARDYPQPEWCDYTDATAGQMGCWSLMSFMIKDINSCAKCDYCLKTGG